MATYTPNINLYMPDPTDDFGEFRKKHNDNMVKIDNAVGGGGGSGGHTIVNENGTDMPAEGKLQFTGNVQVTDDNGNGKTVVDILGGGGNVYGAFIDTNRVITSGTYNTSLTYTATEDCFVVAEWVSPQNDSAYFSIDGERAFTNYASSSVDAGTITLPLKRGQVLTGTTAYNSTKSYKVYGVVQGTNGIFTPIIYSDTERVVGVWRDNKPLYQITIDLGSDRTFSSGWQSFANKADYPDYEYMSAGMLFASSGVCTHVDLAHNDSTYLELRPKASAGGRYLTYQYTKTTDVAGSGNWNTDGVPTVHYSTSEQVIGTWIDGKPIYQCTWTGTKTTNAEEVVISGLVTLDTLVDSKVIFKGNTGAQIAQYFRDASDFGRCWFDSNGIHMDLGNSYPIRPVTWYITLSYTKTTD